MTESIRPLTDPYLVGTGDTLASIARRCGKSIAELQRLNGLRNQNRLSVGQTLYLSEESAFGVSAIFLDVLRWPIKNLSFRVEFDGKTITGVTDEFGRMTRQITSSAASQVAVWVQDAAGTWQRVVETTSGYGHKLMTFVSDAFVIRGKTEPHPPGVPTRVDQAEQKIPPPRSPQPPLPKPVQGTPTTNNPNVKKRPAKASTGQPVIEIGVEIPPALLKLFASYTGDKITEAAWNMLSEDLGCESAVLKAIAHVESGGRDSFWRLNSNGGANIPALVFERHYFSRLTKGQFDSTHPDLSWHTSYQKSSELGKANANMHDGQVDNDDVYGGYARGYLRLVNAYRLDPEAALKSCSWGKFQVMGENHSLCGTSNIALFVKEMCTSELAQMQLLSTFIQKKPRAWKNSKNKALGKEISLLDAVKTNNWGAIAFNYNGPEYRKYQYDEKISAAYMEYSKT